MFRSRTAASIAALAALATVAAAAFTAVRAEAAGAHEFGEMVDYPMTFPVQGPVSYVDGFHEERSSGLHHAADLMAPKGTPVVAVAAGTVERVNWSREPSDLRPDHCCSVTIRHDDGWEAWYVHLNNDSPGTDDGSVWGIADGITPGARVEEGQLIGWVGDSGNAEATPPHLHFELYDHRGVSVNPYQALRVAETGTPSCVLSGTADFGGLLNTARLLRTGTRGTDVTGLQRFLSAVGFEPGPADGVFGPLTDAALRSFQSDRGLIVDGIAGPQTLFAISDYTGHTGRGLLLLLDPNGRLLTFTGHGNDIALLQRWLNALGYDAGPPDGIFGALTQGALQRLQRDSELAADGRFGADSRGAMARALGVRAVRSC